MTAPPDFRAYLAEVRRLLPRARGLQKEWAEAILTCPDLQAAADTDDVAGARTALYAVTLRFWDPEDIPNRVRVALNCLGVEVRP